MVKQLIVLSFSKMIYMKIKTSNLLEYLNWHKSYIKLGIDIKNVREMKLFLFGYEKGMHELNNGKDSVEWISHFNDYTEKKLKNLKDSSQDWASYIEQTQTSEEDGLKKFYELFDEYIESLSKPIIS